jgi:ubiquinone/menaquinone biosynthesis C-methylase UbiE
MTANLPKPDASVDLKNRDFWSELCGSYIARELGVTDGSPESLARFDAWFFWYYPYLIRHIPFARLKGARVLEVGLGYGSVSQRLAECGASLTGLDVAYNPVNMVCQRLRQRGLPGAAIQGSILRAPFDDEQFDAVIAIGCYHHTGNLQGALDETYRVLRRGGVAVVMVYSAYSYRRWGRWPKTTLRQWVSERLGHGEDARTDAEQRKWYDAHIDGSAPPETVFTSARNVRRMATRFRKVRIRRENVDIDLPLLRRLPRRYRLRIFGWAVGLDLYCTLRK